MRWRPLLSLLGAASLLSGCVAAAVPLAAGGAIARRAAGGTRHAAAPASPAAVAAPAAATALPAGAAPMPSDPATMRPGVLYAGALPGRPPAVTDSGPAGPAAPPASPLAAPSGWAAVVRYVAASRVAAPRHGALLARGTAPADARWVDCAGRPRAVLAPLSLVVGRDGGAVGIAEGDLGWIVALPTMGTALVLVAAGPAELAAARPALARSGLAGLREGDTVLFARTAAELPAVRAAIAARYCIVAVAGRQAADFPAGLLPATTPPALAEQWGAGWFLFGPAAG